jgi:hypothetical protein
MRSMSIVFFKYTGQHCVLRSDDTILFDAFGSLGSRVAHSGK